MANTLYGNCKNLRKIWERDFNTNIEEDIWESIVAGAGWSVRDAIGKFTHYKIIHRYYYTPVKLQRMGLMENNHCWKCQKEPGTFLHLLWDCPFVSPLWKQVVKCI